ncbi:MAG: 4-(cytidine 5'-diphospho)-2-C-methyl-D-erythritol kinase [Peptococcaceae bacterium]|nr:4-(cytidine 5'-diphospho)-2-C-methyl-D-erythritol kinase [Peptococcaceae bacterium]
MKDLSIEVLAPAKVNLSLAITEKRTDGFHGLQTVFQTISLYDRIQVSLSGKGIICDCGDLSGENNLAYQAAKAFLEAHQKREVHYQQTGVKIQIEKKIPSQAGLGGGSSDAAAVLRAMNHLYSDSLSYEEMLQCAKRCGSDTAFFLRGGTQWGEGTGTTLTDLPSGPEMNLILVKPLGGVSTGEAYRTFDETGEYGSLDKELWVDLLKNKDICKIGQNLTNSLESAAFKLLPEIEYIKKLLLEKGCYGALMSGSGSVVFGILHGQEQGETIASELAQKVNCTVWLAKTIGPLSDI